MTKTPLNTIQKVEKWIRNLPTEQELTGTMAAFEIADEEKEAKRDKTTLVSDTTERPETKDKATENHDPQPKNNTVRAIKRKLEGVANSSPGLSSNSILEINNKQDKNSTNSVLFFAFKPKPFKDSIKFL